MIFTRPCACGSTVTANPDDPTPGVREHNATRVHRNWSQRTSIAPPLLSSYPTTDHLRVDVSVQMPVRPVRRWHRRRALVGRRVA